NIHRVPLSFPTRRSSDLGIPVDLAFERVLDFWFVGDGNNPGSGRVAVAIVGGVWRKAVAAIGQQRHQERYAVGRVAVGHADNHRDRKSTRLNSSHVKNSY